MYGFIPPANHEFEAESCTWVPRANESTSVVGMVRRSLSFGKKKKGEGSTSRSAPPPAPIPEISTEPRLLNIPKNSEGMIQVTFKAHEVTGDLIIGLVGDNSPAAAAGVEVGDLVLAVQGDVVEVSGGEALDAARNALAKTARLNTVELLLQTKIRTEVSDTLHEMTTDVGDSQ